MKSFEFFFWVGVMVLRLLTIRILDIVVFYVKYFVLDTLESLFKSLGVIFFQVGSSTLHPWNKFAIYAEMAKYLAFDVLDWVGRFIGFNLD